MATGGNSSGDLSPDEEEQALMDRILFQERERLEREKWKKERLEQERLEQERIEQERLEQERLKRKKRKAALREQLKLSEDEASSNKAGWSESHKQTKRTKQTPETVQPPSSQTQPAPLSSTLPLWDRANSDQQQIVSKHHTYKDVFRGRLADLREYVQPELLWVHLIDLEVIDRQTRDKFLSNATPAESVERLVHHLEGGLTWKLHGFLRALAKRDQPEIIELLGFKQGDYQDSPVPCQPPPSLKPAATNKTNTRKPHYYKRVESEEKIQISNDLLPGLLQHCGSYNQTLMKTSLFGFKRNVPIDLTQLYVCHDALCRRNQREKRPVGKMKLFQQLFGTRCPNCLSMEGPAGAGKSSFLENYAHEWSKDFTACEQSGPDAPCEGHLWKLVVYISSGAIRGSAVEAIRDNLRCEPHLQDPMMCAIQEDGDGVLIVYDAMDELRNKESVASISSYTQTSQKMVCKPKVLISARDGLLSVEPRYFDRQLYLEGFSLSQRKKYMVKYFKEMHSLMEHPVLEYVKTDPQDLKWVLSNPLRVHILSELTACGFLKLQDVKTLTRVKLFSSLDQLLLERDKECRQTQHTQPSVFYQVCLRCLLTDQRTLSEEDIGRESPYLSLLQRHEYMGQDFNKCSSFSFPHETLVEYFGMRGLIRCLKDDVVYKQGMLLYLCSEPKMRNVLQLTCGYIAQYESHLLPDVVFIIRACLILQTETVWSERNDLTEELLQLPFVIQDTFPPNVLSHGLTTEQATKLDQISCLIQVVFTEKAECLKEAAWFLNGYPEDSDGMIALQKGDYTVILDCMQQLTHQQQLYVCSQTTHRLLPCTKYNIQLFLGHGTVTVLPINGIRWAGITERCLTEGLHEVQMNLQLPCDLAPYLNTWSHLPRVQQLLHQVQQQRPSRMERLYHTITYYVYVIGSGHPLSTSLPADSWSEEQWTPGLRELLSPSYCTGRITVQMEYSIPPRPLCGLLSACRKVITPGHGLTGGLYIYYGQVAEEELTGFCTWAGEVGLRLQLRQLTVVLRAGRGKKDVKDVDSAIRRRVEVDVGGEKGQLLGPTYVTAGGEVLCKWYKPD